MKLTAKVKLILSQEQKESLIQTLEICNSACNYISNEAFIKKIFGKYKLQSKLYHIIKTTFNLTAQMVVRCVANVADSYKINKKSKHEFRKHAAITYDNRILRWYTNNKTISI